MMRQKSSRSVSGVSFRSALQAMFLAGAISASATEYTEEQQAQVNLALEIVNSYRQLRSSCADVEEHARQMCYYRLKVGLWDYKEARKTLSRFGIRVHSGNQVADR